MSTGPTPDQDQGLILMAHEFLPGFGAFGPRGVMRKSLPVNGRLKRIGIFMDSGAAQEYVFPRPHLFGPNGREIDLADVLEAVQCSTGAGRAADADARRALLAGQPIRSIRDLRPEMPLIFSRPLMLSRIELANRPGQFGPRNRHACVNGYLNGHLVFSHRGMDPAAMVRELRDMHADLGVDLPPRDRAADPETRTELCNALRQRVLDRIEAGTLDWRAPRLAQLLPLNAQRPEMTPFALRVAAAVIAAAMGPRLSVGTVTFAPLSPLLSSPARIDAVIAEANRQLSARLSRPAVLCASKHAIQEPVLVRHRDSYLAVLDAAFPALAACGVTPLLCYGSLLGAVRENAFLTHDDDVDLLYVDGSTSRREMMDRRAELLDRLSAHGFQPMGKLTDTTVNFHIRNADGKLDLFPCWQDGNHLHVMMKYPVYRPVPIRMILPPSQVGLHDRRYPAPADPEAFLAERYGSGWRVPDPYHEWPWPLDSALNRIRTTSTRVIEKSPPRMQTMLRRLRARIGRP